MPRERSLTLFDKLNKEQATKLQRKHSFLFFTLPLNSVGFFSEEGLTSCYKNIFIFVLCLCETQRRLKQDSSDAPSLSHPFRRSSTPPPSVPVSLVVRTGVWYWERQCSWYFLSVASQFSTESKVGGVHSGREHVGVTSGNKVGAITDSNSTSAPFHCVLTSNWTRNGSQAEVALP